MKTDVKQIEVDRTIINDEIESALSKHGTLLRWAVVKATEKKLTVEAVFVE